MKWRPFLEGVGLEFLNLKLKIDLFPNIFAVKSWTSKIRHIYVSWSTRVPSLSRIRETFLWHHPSVRPFVRPLNRLFPLPFSCIFFFFSFFSPFFFFIVFFLFYYLSLFLVSFLYFDIKIPSLFFCFIFSIFLNSFSFCVSLPFFNFELD